MAELRQARQTIGRSQVSAGELRELGAKKNTLAEHNAGGRELVRAEWVSSLSDSLRSERGLFLRRPAMTRLSTLGGFVEKSAAKGSG
jgi:hypothetical protein